MYKKVLSASLTALMLLSMVACGGTDSSTVSAQKETSVSTTVVITESVG